MKKPFHALYCIYPSKLVLIKVLCLVCDGMSLDVESRLDDIHIEGEISRPMAQMGI